MATTTSTVVAATIYAATATEQITILYALWVKRHLERGEAEPARLIQNFDVMPEVREVLEHHLDPVGDPSLVIRSVYGQRLHQLVHLDAKWMGSVGSNYLSARGVFAPLSFWSICSAMTKVRRSSLLFRDQPVPNAEANFPTPIYFTENCVD
jgi:hypothetical protein